MRSTRVSIYDTADAYRAGRSEELLGRAFQGRSDSVVIATKVDYRLGTDGWISRGDKPQRHNLSWDYIFQSCEGSLRRLQRERIDIYQMHRPPRARRMGRGRRCNGRPRAAGQDSAIWNLVDR